MTNTHRALGLLVGLLIGFTASSVSASTISLSSDPVYGEDFIFYCEPYLFPFEADQHFLPEDGACVYSIPDTLAGNTIIALYKGTPNASTLEAIDDITDTNATLLSHTPNVFFSPDPEQSFFAVVYESGLDEGANIFENWLKSGGEIPAGAIENQNYYILPWKWGPKPATEFDPLIIIPDILTTWQTDTEIVLDPLFNAYKNLFTTLENSGYVAGETLFTLAYDWENSNTDNAATLQTLIQEIKTLCNCDQIDVIGHGMGGLVAIHYVQSGAYQNDIDQVITLGTSLFGIPSAYRAWEGGEITFGNPVQDGVIQSLLTAKADALGYANVFEYVQDEPVASFRDLLPTFFDYLSGKSYPNDYPQNTFGENILLNLSDTFLVNPLVRYYPALGDDGNGDTPVGFDIVSSSEPPKWPHGQPSTILLDAGDGSVPRVSIENILGPIETEFSVEHEALPTAAQSHIFEVLNGRVPDTVVNNSYPTSCVLFLTVSEGTDFQLTDPNGQRLGRNLAGSGNFSEIERSVYSGPAAEAEYLAVANPVDGTYQVQTQGNVNGSFTLTATDVCNDGTHSTSTVGTIAPGQVLGYSVTVDPDDTLSIEPLDTSAPQVTIHTPADGAAYFSTDSVLASVTITDPDSAPIAQTLYRLNGALINPLNPLPLTAEPLGSAVLAVSAIDVFGNTGHATSTFTIEAPPSEASTTIPVTADTYLRGIASDTNEGASPILRITGLGDNRIVVKVDQQTIADAVGTGNLMSAALEFEVEDTLPTWGRNGREVVVNRLLMGWTEGNGKNAEVRLRDRFRGSGAGATWDCATDSNIKNLKKDCGPTDDWNMRLLRVLQNLSLPWVEQSTDGVYIQKSQHGIISFDVTADVQAFLDGATNNGWIVRKSPQNRPGYISFHSRETGDSGPRLVLTFGAGN